MLWKPLLEGQLATAASHAVRDIAIEIASAPPALVAPADRTLFWAYATNVVDEPFAHAAYDAAMDDLVSALQQGVAHASLYDGGLAGIGWTLNHVLDGGAEDVLEVIDEALVGVIDVERWAASNDLAQGLVGYGVYFLERLATNPNAAIARDGLDRVVRHLERNATRTDDGATWLTTLDVMPAPYRAEYPHGFHDCGVAHGVPGMIAFLSRAARAANDNRARSLGDEALRWLAARRLDPHPSGRFPAMVKDERCSRARAAWCYGDPGVAAALWSSAPELARETALECAARDEATSGVRDAGLCHGAAGLGHLYNRFFQATGEPVLRDAAREWFGRTLAMRRPDGVAGFAAYRGDEYEASHGLIEGAIGIALALLAAIGSSEPNWDRVMLCDLAAGGV